MTPRREFVGAALLIAIFIGAAATSVSNKSATVDEFAHLAAGCHAWRTRDFSLYPKTPPTGRMLLTLPATIMGPKLPLKTGRLGEGAWGPWTYGTAFMRANFDEYGKLLTAARLGGIVVGTMLCVLVWRWSRARYGPAGGLTSLAAAALSPTLIAHARLVTIDVVCALAVLLLLLAMTYYLKRPSASRVALMAAALGAAILCKFSGILFAPFGLLAPVAAYFNPVRAKDQRPQPLLLLGHAALVVVVVWLVVVVGYLGAEVSFNRRMPIASTALQTVAPVVRLAPLPKDFLLGLDQQLFDAQSAEFTDGNYLLGERYSGGKWYYNLVAAAAKEPLPYLTLFIAAAVLAVWRRERDFFELMLLAIAVAYFIAASFGSSLQIGVRYLLVIYPIGFLLSGRLGQAVFNGTPEKKFAWQNPLRAALLFCLLWAMVDVARVWPDYLAYFNPAAGGPTNGHRVLLDSNLDWGQDLPGLKSWMDENSVERLDLAYFGHDDPARFGIVYDLPGRGSKNPFIAVSANFLSGRTYPMTFSKEQIRQDDPMWEEINRYRNEKPVAVIGHSIFIYNWWQPIKPL